MNKLNYTNDQNCTLVQDLHRDQLKEIEEKKLLEAFRYRYHLNDAQHNILQSYFEHQYVLTETDPAIKLKSSMHPIMAILNDYSIVHANRIAATAHGNGIKVLTVGDSSTKRVNNTCHNCLLLDNPREAYRIISSNTQKGSNKLMCEAARTGRFSGLDCLKGTQNCEVESDIMLYMHSLYDITPQQFAQAMLKHKAKQCYAYMHLPVMLCGDEYSEIEENVIRIKRTGKDGATKLCMSMGDSSIPYIHDEVNWKAWNTVTTITFGGFRIVREDIAQHGPLHIINFCITQNLPCEIFKTHPLSKYGTDYYLVPSLKELMHNNFAGDFKNLKKYVVKRHIVDRLLTYASRQADEAYKYTEFSTVFSGLIYNIRFGNKEIQEATIMSPRKTQDVTLSLFIIGALRRQDRTKVISETFSHIKKWYNSTWTLDVRNWFQKHENDLTQAYDGDYTKASQNSTRIKWFNVFEFEDENIQHNIDVKVDFPIINNDAIADDYYYGDEESDGEHEFSQEISDTDGQNYDEDIIDHYVASAPPEPELNIQDPDDVNNTVNNFAVMDEGRGSGQLVHNNDIDVYVKNPKRYTAKGLFNATNNNIIIKREHTKARTRYLNEQAARERNNQELLDRFRQNVIEEVDETNDDDDTDTDTETNATQELSTDEEDEVEMEPILVDREINKINTLIIDDNNDQLDEEKYRSTLISNDMHTQSNKTVEEALESTFHLKRNNHAERMLYWHGIEADLNLINRIETAINEELNDEFLNELHFLRDKKLKDLSFEEKQTYKSVLEIDPIKYMLKFNKVDQHSTGISSSMKLDIEEIIQNKLLTFSALKLPTHIFNICFNNWAVAKNDKGTAPLMSETMWWQQKEIRDFYVVSNRNSSVHKHFSLIPSVFGAGHCAVKAVWECIPKHKKPKIGKMLREIYYFAKLTGIQTGVDEYIMEGWNNENSSLTTPFINHALSILSYRYSLRIRVFDETTNNLVIFDAGEEDATKIIIYYKNQHYSTIAGGGTTTTLEKLLSESKIIQGDKEAVFKNAVIIEPSTTDAKVVKGILNAKLCDTIKYYRHIPKEMVVDPLVENTHAWDDECALKNVFTTKYDFIFWDINYTFKYCDKIIKYINFMQNPKTVNIIVSKQNHPEMWRLSSLYKEHELITVGEQVAHIFRGYTHNIDYDHLNNCYDLYHQDETTHEIPFDLKKTIAFAKNHFKDICAEQLPRVLNALKAYTNHKYPVNIITGYASAGKTRAAMEKYKNESVWIAPSRILSMKHNEDGAQSYTQHTVFPHLNDQWQCIVIDEISQFTVEFVSMIYALCPNAIIVCVGDVNQCDGFAKGTSFEEVGVTTNMLKVHAVPFPICKAMNDRFGYMMLGDPKNDKPVYILDKAVKLADLIKTGVQFICLNDTTQKKMVTMGAKCSTITTYQGSRTHTVCFYIDDKSVTSQLTNRSKFVYTAMTRATKNLVLYGNTNLIEQFLTINGSPLRNLEEFNGIYHANDTYVETIEDGGLASVIMGTSEGFDGVEKVIVTEQPVVDTLLNSIKPVNDSAPFHSISSTRTATLEQGTFNAPAETLVPDQRTFRSYQYLPNIKLLRDYVNTPEDCKNALTHRYALKVKFQKEREVKFNANCIIRGICKALFGNERSIDKLKNGLKTQPEELRRHAADYLASAQKKLGKNHTFVKELETEFICWDEIISLVTKKQSKFDANEGFDASDKAGQGVASLSKRVNLLFSAYARAMLCKIREIAHANGRKIIIATHDSDEVIANEFYSMNTSGGKWACFDVSQWDSRFTRFMAEVTRTFLQWMGCPDWINNWWFDFRQQWRIICHTKYGNMSLKGYEKQFSGNPFTICENTLCNLGLINIVFDFVGVSMQMAKGDDSAIKCEDYHMTEEGKKLLANTGHILKKHFDTVGDFAGYILTDAGMVPDLLRYACKFIGKPYHDQAQFDESKANAKAQASIITTQHQLITGCYALEIFYKHLKITAMQFQIMYNFLKNCDQIKFSSLTLVEKPKLIVTN